MASRVTFRWAWPVIAALLAAGTVATGSCEDARVDLLHPIGYCPEDPSLCPDGAPDGADDVASEPVPDAAGDVPAEEGERVGAKPCGPFARPAAVPADWEEYTGWSCGCRLYVPGKTGKMPLPIEWEPCPGIVGGGLSCKNMKTPWATKPSVSITVWPQFWFDAISGTAYIQFGRVNGTSVRYRLVAETDGPVRVAFLQVNPQNLGCELSDASVRDGRYAFNITGDTWAAPLYSSNHGVIAGVIGEPVPTFVSKSPIPWIDGQPSLAGWVAGQGWLLRSHGQIWATSWQKDKSVLVYDPAADPDKLPAHADIVIGNDAFWNVNAGGLSGVMSWNLNDGARPLVRWFGDYSKGAGAFGTDGKDMVWVHGEGKQTDLYAWPKLSVYTASYTTDPAVVKATAKRLRSAIGTVGPQGWQVGCGHAARHGSASGKTNDLQIVRLSDGRGWVLPGADDPQKFSYMMALGLTCDEVFATAMFSDQAVAILRIGLESLGPGLPPD